MFKSRKKEKVAKQDNGVLQQAIPEKGGSTCVISAGTRIEGKFHATEDVRLDGVIIGEVSCDKRIVMGDSGKVEGTIESKDLIVRGTIKGDVSVKNLLHLQQSAYIEGTINASSMIVDEGASYNGECKVGKRSTNTTNHIVKQKVA